MLFKSLFLFFSYSIIGWIIEVIVMYYHTKKFNNRGFLIGPYCPIYGSAAIIMTFSLQGVKNNYLLLFLLSMVICSLIEYFTSYSLEKIFGARWWDYSENKFNLNGRICLFDSILFGIMGFLLVKFSNPLFFNLFNYLPIPLINSISITLLIIFLSDFFISFKIIKNMPLDSKGDRRDYTEEISKLIKKRLFARKCE